MMAEAALFTAAMPSFMLLVVSIRKHRALLDLLEIPIALPGAQSDTHTHHHERKFQSRKLRDADSVPHCRKVLSPAASRMSSSSSLVAAVAMLAAAVCRKLWLALNESLLMPPLASMVLV